MKSTPKPRLRKIGKAVQDDPALLGTTPPAPPPARETEPTPPPAAPATTGSRGTSTGSHAGQDTNGRSRPRPTPGTDSPLRATTVRVPEDVLDRARTAWRTEAAHPDAPYPTFSAWMSQAIAAAVERSEAAHNGGRPYTGTPAGVIPTGRPHT